jgi:hypothetical protein
VSPLEDPADGEEHNHSTLEVDLTAKLPEIVSYAEKEVFPFPQTRSEPEAQPRREISGHRWLLFVLVALVLIGAIVGGAVGGVLHRRRHS